MHYYPNGRYLHFALFWELSSIYLPANHNQPQSILQTNISYGRKHNFLSREEKKKSESILNSSHSCFCSNSASLLRTLSHITLEEESHNAAFEFFTLLESSKANMVTPYVSVGLPYLSFCNTVYMVKNCLSITKLRQVSTETQRCLSS